MFVCFPVGNGWACLLARPPARASTSWRVVESVFFCRGFFLVDIYPLSFIEIIHGRSFTRSLHIYNHHHHPTCHGWVGWVYPPAGYSLDFSSSLGLLVLHGMAWHGMEWIGHGGHIYLGGGGRRADGRLAVSRGCNGGKGMESAVVFVCLLVGFGGLVVGGELPFNILFGGSAGVCSAFPFPRFFSLSLA